MGEEHHLRADAQANRERIFQAAREVFAEEGPSASLNSIAQRAGVGNATLYRHFATADELRQAIFTDWMAELAAALREQDEIEDPAARLAGYLTWMMEHPNITLVGLILDDSPQAEQMRHSRETINASVGRMLAEGHERGCLRADLSREDLEPVAISAVVVGRHPRVSPAQRRRFLRFLLDALTRQGEGA